MYNLELFNFIIPESVKLLSTLTVLKLPSQWRKDEKWNKKTLQLVEVLDNF